MINKKGSVMIYTLMLGITIIILVMALMPTGKEFVDSAMGNSTADFIGLNCTDSSISSFTKATCAITDFSLFYVFGGLLFLGGIVVVSRVVFS